MKTTIEIDVIDVIIDKIPMCPKCPLKDTCDTSCKKTWENFFEGKYKVIYAESEDDCK